MWNEFSLESGSLCRPCLVAEASDEGQTHSDGDCSRGGDPESHLCGTRGKGTQRQAGDGGHRHPRTQNPHGGSPDLGFRVENLNPTEGDPIAMRTDQYILLMMAQGIIIGFLWVIATK